MSFLAGSYTGVWNSLSLGQVLDGFTFHSSVAKALIQGDNEGERIQDAIYEGEDLTSDFVCLEGDAAAFPTLIWPYSATWLTGGVPGRVDSQQSLVKSLVLTAVAGTPNAGDIATLTCALSILHENYPVDIILSARRQRNIPVRMRHYPNGSRVYGVAT